jgi:hypothetical protein
VHDHLFGAVDFLVGDGAGELKTQRLVRFRFTNANPRE